MHRSSPSKVQTTHLSYPAGRIPCPTCDSIINDSGPDEHEDDTWKHATTLGNGADSQSNTDEELANSKYLPDKQM